MARKVNEAGSDPSLFPCVHIAYYAVGVCKEHNDPYECPDLIIDADAGRNKFGIPVRDGGRSWVPIRFCPWCGIHLPNAPDTS
jgi:hypothetical protein